MIRIIDEPVIELTQQEHRRLLAEYANSTMYEFQPPDFETWLMRFKCLPTTTLGRIPP